MLGYVCIHIYSKPLAFYVLLSHNVTHILCTYLYIQYITGDYDASNTVELTNFHTCVSKDLRPGFEGHKVVEVNWSVHPVHGMYT